MNTTFARHIEEPKRQFQFRVLRAPVWNVLHRPARWEDWTILAETREGAVRIAQYHFCRSTPAEIVPVDSPTLS